MTCSHRRRAPGARKATRCWTHCAVDGTLVALLDLNDVRVFEKVASLRSFAAAARALSQPKSNVSRSVARLEASLGTRLIQRTTRDVSLTSAGAALLDRCASLLSKLDEALDYVGRLAAEPRGQLTVSVGIGFGINVLAGQLPAFLRRYPDVDVVLDLTSRASELISERVDVAIRLGPVLDSSMVSVRLGEMRRILCASPTYLRERGAPHTLAELASHQIIEMPRRDGRAHLWRFTRGSEATDVTVYPRVVVNDALTIHRLVTEGAGVGIISCYLCAPALAAGTLVHLVPDWTAATVTVTMVFPTKRELAPAVRAFVEFMKESNVAGVHWQNNTLHGET
ncbi:MAG: LysR family transcriptional regulator [Polyangiaceae bacterium]